jgi:hypothetical protein
MFCSIFRCFIAPASGQLDSVYGFTYPHSRNTNYLLCLVFGVSSKRIVWIESFSLTGMVSIGFFWVRLGAYMHGHALFAPLYVCKLCTSFQFFLDDL